MRPVEIIRKPCDPNGEVIHDDSQIETLTFGAARLIGGKSAVPTVAIELAQHTDGLWMWATHTHFANGGGGYRVGPKWGKFADTRDEALWAACYEIKERLAGKRDDPKVIAMIDWLDELDGTAPVQQELFA